MTITFFRVGLLLAVVVGGGGAAALAAVRDALWQRGELRQPRVVWLGIGWVAGLALAWLSVRLLPNLHKPVGLGLVWLAIGAVVSPIALVAAEQAARRRPPRVAWPRPPASMWGVDAGS